jgi:hypothetical protein
MMQIWNPISHLESGVFVLIPIRWTMDKTLIRYLNTSKKSCIGKLSQHFISDKGS